MRRPYLCAECGRRFFNLGWHAEACGSPNYTLHASPDDLLDEPDTGLPEGRRSPSSPPVSGSSSGPSAAGTASEAPSASRSSVRGAPDDARSALTLFPVQQGAYGDVAA